MNNDNHFPDINFYNHALITNANATMNLQTMNTINTIPAAKSSKKRNQDNSTDDKPKTTKKQKNNNVIVEGTNDGLMLCTVIAGAGKERDNNTEAKNDNKVKKLCPHNISKQKCKECSSYFCLHNKQKYLCKECGGKGNSLIITLY